MNIVKTFPFFKLKAVTFSFDDGVYQDVEMLNMLRHFSLKATFNLNSNLLNGNGDFYQPEWLLNKRLEKKQIKDLYDGFEVASHSSNHSDFKNQSTENLDIEIKDDINNLSKIVGYKVQGFAYPYGIYSSKIINYLKELGIVYARSVNHTLSFDLPNDFYTYGGTIEMSSSEIEKMTTKWLQLKPEDMKLYYIWGHSYELDMFHEHEKFYYLLEKLAHKDDTFYGTNIEIFSYLNALKELEVTENKLINHSNKTLYLLVNKNKVILKSKEIIEIEKEK